MKRLEAWLDAELRRQARAARGAERSFRTLSGLARGLAFNWPRISACCAATRSPPRSRRSTKQRARSLRKYGVRFGAFNIYIPALLKPARGRSRCCCCGRSIPAATTASTPMRCRRGRSRGSPRSRRATCRSLIGARPASIRGRARGAHRHAGAAVRPHPRARGLEAAEGGVARAVRRDRRRRLPCGARADVGGRLLGRGFRLDLESARLQARAAQARARGWRRGDFSHAKRG